MAKFAKGAAVRQVVPTVEGNVMGYSVDQETGDVLVLVEWTDADGETHSRYFKEGELASITPTA
jgi:hypothetical protein